MNSIPTKLVNTVAVSILCVLFGCQSNPLETKPTPEITLTPSPADKVSPTTSSAGVLERVKTRGKLICGVNGKLPGFSFVDDKGMWSGLDVDFCRAIAAAVLGSDKAVEFKPVSVQQRFTAIQTGEIDVLLRNTTWTLSRDAENPIAFAPTVFFDGQGLMVNIKSNSSKKSSEVKSVEPSEKKPSEKSTAKSSSPEPGSSQPEDERPETKATETKTAGETTALETLKGKTICVESGTSEAVLVRAFKDAGVKIKPLGFPELDRAYNTYAQGKCDAISSEKSQLAAWRSKLPKSDEHKILDISLSQEPLSPATISNDDSWHDVVSWVVFSTFYASELGIDRKNYTSFKDSKNPDISRFLGTSEALGIKLGLAPDWTTQVLKAVGNYDDIYNRNLDPLGLPRGLNKSWKQGGLIYSMPFR